MEKKGPDMMREVPSLFIALAVSVIVCGCIQSPAGVAKEVPGVLSNVSNDVGNVTGHVESNVSQFVVERVNVSSLPTLAPIHR